MCPFSRSLAESHDTDDDFFTLLVVFASLIFSLSYYVCCLFVCVGFFKQAAALNSYLSDGGCIILSARASDDTYSNRTLNQTLLSEYGITLQDDCIMRTVYYRNYFHPKEAFILDACPIPMFCELAGRKVCLCPCGLVLLSSSSRVLSFLHFPISFGFILIFDMCFGIGCCYVVSSFTLFHHSVI